MSTILLLIAILAAGHGVSSQACSRKLDLLFYMDGSSSICGSESCPEWRNTLQFVKNIIASFKIGPDATRVAVITDSNGGKMEWNFDQYLDQNSLSSAIDNVVRSGIEIDSVLSLKDIVTKLITTATSQRSDATMIVISISDGAPKVDNVLAQAANIAVQALGLNEFNVCVTPRCPADLARSFSSPPRQLDVTYYLVNDFGSLDKITENLVKQLCSFKSPGVVGSITGGVSNLLGF